MKYLEQNTRIPVPKVFDWACGGDPENTVGVGYILMEKLNGQALNWYAATPTQREKVMEQLADVFLELEEHPFEAMGSLIRSTEKDVDIQGIADQSVFRVGQGPLGPFSSPLEGSQALIRSYLSMIASGEIDAHSPVDIYLAHRLRLRLAEDIWGHVGSSEKFFLKHPDDKGDHIMVNGSYEIVGIIDWEWTQTVSKAEAFCSPCMMWPLQKFYSGSNELARDELRFADIFRKKGRQDLAECIMGGRKVQRFLFSLGADVSFLDFHTFTELFAGSRDAFHCGDDCWEDWKNKVIKEWGDDEMLKSLLRFESGRVLPST